MKVSIKGKTTNFDVNIVSKLDYEEFEILCSEQSTFKQLPEKERIAKIKDVYENIRTAKGVEDGNIRLKKSENVQFDNKGKGAGDIATEQGAIERGEKHQKSENKAKIQRGEIRKEKGKNES